MKRLLAVVSLVALAGGCEEKKDGKSAEASEANEASEAKPVAQGSGSADPVAKEDDSKVGTGLKAPAAATLTKAEFKKDEVPNELAYKGKLNRGLRFSDKNGDNWVLFSKLKSKTKNFTNQYIYAHHYAIGPNGVKELRVVKDKIENCDLDMKLKVTRASIGVTDLDGDGIGEVAFGYELQCAGDLSPADYKFLMLEGGDKYIIRGTTKLDLAGDDVMGGKMNVDKSFKDGPKEFLVYAKKRWKKLTYRDMSSI